MSINVVDAGAEHWKYVSLCTHVDEPSPDQMRAAEMRSDWLRRTKRVLTKVALDKSGDMLGFVHFVPIDSPCSGLLGRDLMVILCLTLNYQLVRSGTYRTGVGRALVAACEDESRRARFKGVAVRALDDVWFMPSGFFRRLGFHRISEKSRIWIKKWDACKDPIERLLGYNYRPVPGKVVIDYFWSPFCLNTCKEIIDVRQAVSEFGHRVVLREQRTDEAGGDCMLHSALFVNGVRKQWHEAPLRRLKEEISKALGGS